MHHQVFFSFDPLSSAFHSVCWFSFRYSLGTDSKSINRTWCADKVCCLLLQNRKRFTDVYPPWDGFFPRSLNKLSIYIHFIIFIVQREYPSRVTLKIKYGIKITATDFLVCILDFYKRKEENEGFANTKYNKFVKRQGIGLKNLFHRILVQCLILITSLIECWSIFSST